MRDRALPDPSGRRLAANAAHNKEESSKILSGPCFASARAQPVTTDQPHYNL